ncbi:MAG: hypothetical protein FWC60_01185 [Firmicutes bacterium]|nr:hypothetical protein [Bacillota bacterium]
MSGCGSCSSCNSSDKGKEYKNQLGQSAVKCTLCEQEIVFEKLPKSGKVRCEQCDTVIQVIPLLLH